MRNRREICERIEALKPSAQDPFGVQAGLLVSFLKYRDALTYIKAGTDRETWEAARQPATEDHLTYLIHAGVRASWKFANECKVIEVNKGFMVLEGLCWMLGREFHEWFVDLVWTPGKMAHYGKPQLVELHGRFRLGPWKENDNGKWHNSDFDIDLPAEQALRQWHAKWDKTVSGGGSVNGS